MEKSTDSDDKPECTIKIQLEFKIMSDQEKSKPERSNYLKAPGGKKFLTDYYNSLPEKDRVTPDSIISDVERDRPLLSAMILKSGKYFENI